MRRWLILFLLSLLPLQITWAAAATVDYCAHDREQTAQHFGHHEDAHPAGAEKPDRIKQQTGQLKLDHDHNHLSGFLGLLSEISVSTQKSPQIFLRSDELAYLSIPPDNRERPNWRHPV